MTITGHLLINGQWRTGDAGSFQAVNPASGEPLPTTFTQASPAQVVEAASAAGAAFGEYRMTSLKARAGFLRACAEGIMALGDELLETMEAETGYPRMRCEGERGRTAGQLNMFADYIEAGDYLDARIDTAQPDRQPPKPDIRYLNQPLGVVTVFAVSNFPLAFSTAGGDTASALAAGCPVIVKGHPSHPGTGELVAGALAAAAKKTGMPAGVFSFLQCDNGEAGQALIQAPEVKAIGFTGSLRAGTAISRLAAERAEPIPVFAEMGSINPLILLPGILSASAASVASGFVGSLTLGTGQFCVNPGLVIAIDGEGLDNFIAAAKQALAEVPAGVMLNGGIRDHYDNALAALDGHPALTRVAAGQAAGEGAGVRCQAALYKVDSQAFLDDPALQGEVFGPASLVVACRDEDDLNAVVDALNGQLTATVHGTEAELAGQAALFAKLSLKAGRVVVNGFPTGVEVCAAMMHGGPFPASTDSRFTSVGTAAIRRFLRPVCYQGLPPGLFPEALRDDNPLGLMRTVNGALTRDPVR